MEGGKLKKISITGEDEFTRAYSREYIITYDFISKIFLKIIHYSDYQNGGGEKSIISGNIKKEIADLNTIFHILNKESSHLLYNEKNISCNYSDGRYGDKSISCSKFFNQLYKQYIEKIGKNI